MTRLQATYVLIGLFSLPVASTRGQAETPAQYTKRAGDAYERKEVPEAIAQVSKRAKLTKEESTRVGGAFREHIHRYLTLYGRGSCFTRSDWQKLLSQFDDAIAKRLSASKAAAVAEWRKKPWPEGNALGFLFFSPWMEFDAFDAAVTARASGGATDCGFLKRNSPHCPVEECVIDAVKKKKPFRAMFEERGIDSRIAHAIVGRADGTGIALDWDSMGGRIAERPCRFRIGRSVHGGEHVDCE